MPVVTGTTRGRAAQLLLLLLVLATDAQLLGLAYGARSPAGSTSSWPTTGPHLFVDNLAGLQLVSDLSLVQHRARKTGDMAVVPEHAWEPYIDAYNSLVQVR